MDKPSASSPGASVTDADDYWSRLTDDELRAVIWTTERPQDLQNLKSRVPLDLPDFIIEQEYQLDRATEAAVPCAHCPHHQPHWHGFVLLASDGARYLLGSHCGPKAYASDYWIASAARNRAKKRAEVLLKWDRLRDRLPDLLGAIDDARRTPSFAAVRRFRGAWLGHARGVRDALRRLPRNHLTRAAEMKVSRSFRDEAAEQAREAAFMAEVGKLADLPNKSHRIAVTELRQRLGTGEIWRTLDADFGTLKGEAWLVGTESPFTLLDDATKRLRAYHVLGATTQDKKTSELERFIRDTTKDLGLAADQFTRIRSASDFFDPDHLARLTAWAAAVFTPETKRRIVFSEGELLVADGYNTSQRMRFPSDWDPPGSLFLELRAAAVRG